MTKQLSKCHASALLAAVLLLTPLGVMGQSDLERMQARIQSLEQELQEMKALLQQQIDQSASKEEVETLKQQVVETQVAEDEWKTYDSAVHLAGYGSVSYTDDDTGGDRFNQASISPIFHFQWKDLVLFESEIEMEIAENGETELDVEYVTIDLMLHDYATLIGGRFLSPIGQFRQNYHPGWINKIADAPPGFGHHGGAAPLSNVGFQVRGGFPVPFGEYAYLNYALFVGNGPELELAGEHEEGAPEEEAGDAMAEEDEEQEIEMVEAEGSTSDEDGNKVFGGRIGFVPIPNVEIGFSGAFSEVALEDEADRDYEVLDVDFKGSWRNFRLLGEWVRTEVDDLETSVAPEGHVWES